MGIGFLIQADVVEAGADEADGIIENALWESVAEGGNPFSIQAASICGGCWEVLPETCRCGVVRMCGHCADVFMEVDGEAAQGEGTGEVTMDMVRLELQRMVANVERVGSLGHGLTEMHERLDDVSEQMVARDSYGRLLYRLRQLEVGVGSLAGAADVEREFEELAFHDEHSGYTDCEDYEEEERNYGSDFSD